MIEVFLGVIAVAVLVMAAIQVAAVVLAARAARRVDRIADRFERDMQPVVASLQALTADAARATALAASQVERADRLFADLSSRVLALIRDLKPSKPRAASVDEDDALFIG